MSGSGCATTCRTGARARPAARDTKSGEGSFGFEPAGPLGLTYAPVPPELPHFQIARLSRYTPELAGTFVYCWEP